MDERCVFYPVSAVVGQVQLCLFRAEIDSGFLAHHLGVDGLVGLHTHHQLVPPALSVKDVSRNVCELQPHLCLPLIQSLSTPEDEGNTWRETGRERPYTGYIRYILLFGFKSVIFYFAVNERN